MFRAEGGETFGHVTEGIWDKNSGKKKLYVGQSGATKTTRESLADLSQNSSELLGI